MPRPRRGEAVALVGVTKRFPGVLAVDDVSLAFRAGEVHVLLGENGAGKSTIVSMLARGARARLGASDGCGSAGAAGLPG